jgi:hypothetical protein
MCFPRGVLKQLLSVSRAEIRYPWHRSLLVLTIFILSFTKAAFATPHKLRVSDVEVAKELVAKGAKVKVDYGGFQLLEVDDANPGLVTLSKAKGEFSDELDVIELRAGHLNTRAAEVKALRVEAKPFAGKRLHLVQFIGPVKNEWKEALEQDGLQIVSYLPNDAYLVYGTHGALRRLQTRAQKDEVIQWEGPYADEYKIHPAAKPLDPNGKPQKPATDTYSIQLVGDADANAGTLQLIDALKAAPVRRQEAFMGYVNVVVSLPAERLADLARRPEVVSIQPYYVRRKFCERQDQIIAGNLSGNVPNGAGYLTWLGSKGFTQAQFTSSAFAVDVTDSGIDNGSTLPGHFGLYASGTKASGSRVAYSRLEGSGNPGSTTQGCDGHGNLNAHIIGGYDNLSGFPFADASGYHFGLGVCPFVRVGSSVIFDPANFTDPTFANLASRAYRDGARISNNSWGADTAGAYDIDCQTYDALVRDAQPSGSSVAVAGNQEMVFVFAAGNAGPGIRTVGSPGTAKNVITVGAGENVQPFGTDASGISDSGANSAADIIDFSSRGPCVDSRIKPDICAPGTHVSGGVAQVASPAANGTAIACFDGNGVSGGSISAVDSIFFPTGQEFYTASSGTSHSTPAVAGCCALLRQFFINNALVPPSPAMTKGFLMNSARYMTGSFANDTLPSNNQGMGSVNLGTAFDGVARILRDQESADKFTATGQTRVFAGNVAASNKPFRVTLAWTDAPGSTTGNAYKNNLDLTVTVGGNTYKGNVFSGASSTPGGISDLRNNVESVFLPAGVSGAFTVTITAANINSDGVPNQAPSVDQDFALVIYNGQTGPVAPSVVTAPQSQNALVGDNVSFSVDVSGSGPFAYQWRKNSADISAATNSSYTLSTVQTNDSGNFDVVITNVAGSVTSSVATLVVTAPLTNLSVIAQWNFNSSPPDASAATGSLLPSVGSGSLTWVGGVTTNFFGGGGFDAAVSDNTALGLANYPPISASNKTAGARFAVSTAGKQHVVIRWDQRVSNTGSKYCRLQYTTNGTAFIDASTSVAVGTPAVFEAKTNNLAGLPGVDNNPNFAFRLVTEWEITATGAGSPSYAAAQSTSTYAGSGTVRYDWVTVFAEPLVPNPISSLGSLIAGADGQFQFTVAGNTGSLYVIQVSSNLTAWQSVSTNSAPFNFSVTNAPADKQRFYRALYQP